MRSSNSRGRATPMRKRSGRGIDPSGRSKKTEPFVQLPHWVMESVAYRALTVGPRCLLAELQYLYNGRNNGQIFLSTRGAAELLHVTKETANAWFWALEETGFIHATARGSQSVKYRHATSWLLTQYRVGDTPPTKDFTRWRVGDSLAGRKPPSSCARIARAAIQAPSKSRNEMYRPTRRSHEQAEYVSRAVNLGMTEAGTIDQHGSRVSD